MRYWPPFRASRATGYGALKVLAEIPLEQFDKLTERVGSHVIMGWNGHNLTVGHVKAARAAIAKAEGG